MRFLRKLLATGTGTALLYATGCTGGVVEPPYDLVAGMPEYVSYHNVYGGAGPDMLSDQVREHPALVYVPSFHTGEISVIDQQTRRVVDVFDGGPGPRHVVPAYDLRRLYVGATGWPGGLVAIDPATGRPADLLEITEVNNLYFSPDGQEAIVVADHGGLDFYQADDWEFLGSLALPECQGASYLDYSADGRIALISCAVDGSLLALASETNTSLGVIDLGAAESLPQDVRLTPDGDHFLVADMQAGGVHVINDDATELTGFVPTGRGAHAIYFSRDADLAYVVNRTESTITVLSLDTLAVIDEWEIPGGSPDLGGLDASGSVLWLAGGDHDEVYAIRTEDGELLARIPVGAGPYSLVVWPQPGRYSLGGTGNIR